MTFTLSSIPYKIFEGGFRRLPSIDEKPCRHPRHDPPVDIDLDPGCYEYECPGCGWTVRLFVVEEK